MTAHGVMFHHFYDKDHVRGQGAVSADELIAIINHVGRDRILSAEEWLVRADRGTLGDNDVCLTLDDALLCQYDVALPVLSELGLTAFWFVYSSVFEGQLEPLEIYRYFRTTSFPTVDDFYRDFSASVAETYPQEYDQSVSAFEGDSYLAEFPFYTSGDRLFRYLRDEILGSQRYETVMATMMDAAGFDHLAAGEKLWMNDDHLRLIGRAGHKIGLHSFSHPTRLVELDPGDQAEQYRKNAEHLERVTGEPVVCMSHPCNSYDESTLSILADMGVTLGFRSNMAKAPNPVNLEFPREDHANIMKVLNQ